MLSFFRRIINSKAGIVITFIVLGVIALAFAAGDVTGLRSSGIGGLTGSNVATIGSTKITVAELRSRVQTELDGIRQQQPTLDMAKFVAEGGFDGTLQRMISGTALEAFGKAQGMVVSRRSVDGQIASIPGLQGPTGQFDPQLYQRILADRKMTDAQVRGEIARDAIAQALIQPTQGASQVAAQLALPYASLLLEKRAGLIGFVPTRATGAAPSDSDLAAFYARNVARYTLPERRVVRYAIVTPDQVAARATPTEAEIAQAYKTAGSRFAATQKRTVVQVVVGDQAGANALAARVRGGTPLAAAAQAAGLEASTQTGVEKAAYARATTPGIADAVFAAARGAVVGPVRGTLGYTVARVEAIDQVAGKSLVQAHGELVAELTKQKTTQALSDIRDALDDSFAKNTTFDEAVTDQKLAAQTTPPLVAAGTSPDAPGFQPTPAIRAIATAAFQAQDGDGPQLVQTGTDGGFAVVTVGRTLRRAPQPLAQVRDAVARDVAADHARAAARRIAADIVAKAERGIPLQQAIAQAGVALPPARPAAASRAQIAANPQVAPAPLVLMFSMAQGTAKLLEAANNIGWYVIKLDRIEPGSAVGNAAAIGGVRGQLAQSLGREYVEQFAHAVRTDVGVKTDAAAIARVRAELLDQGGSNTN